MWTTQLPTDVEYSLAYYVVVLITSTECVMTFALKGEYEAMLSYYRQLLSYIKTAVTKNYSEKSINAILDYISTSKQMDLLQKFYETTLDALRVQFLFILLDSFVAWIAKHVYILQSLRIRLSVYVGDSERAVWCSELKSF